MDSSVKLQVVLVVEDEALLRMFLVDALEEAGLTAVEAHCADAAIAEFSRRRNIGAVVTDVRMPGSMDGLGLAAWMRDHQPGVPVIICSGTAPLGDLNPINPAILRVVSKPYMADDIAGMIAALVR